MDLTPQLPDSAGPLAQMERRLLALIQSVRLEQGVGYKVRPGTRGTVLELEAAPAAAASGVLVAQVVAEGADALLCTVDGGATTFPVMKPEPLRRSWMLGDYLAEVRHIYKHHSTVVQVLDQGWWDQYGYVLSVKPNSAPPTVQEEYQAIWPPYVDAVGEDTASTPVNQPRAVNLTYGRTVSLICARVSGAGRVNAADLASDELGDTVVSHVDITPGRRWLPTDVIRQTQVVMDVPGGTAIGSVDNQPDNS
ncbi:MAG: hypothetical protein FD161_888 [Limisphaerales bacterium]|nr:MAG: hypothetical protein FD161_888 [Limisphaerales bacterium]KAG0510047.1 MAG: hypothetical protein E1N63_888 [Limisphaerales bacterium]TXT53063.1 MAG: hypothetical protein FD140_171 [Limisphaerales bacterium]